MENGYSVNVLTGFGLTNYEAKIYLALLEKNYLSATEIARLTKVPRTCVYDDLKTLEQKGLCKSITGKTKLYSAVAPSLAKDVLYQTEQQKVESKINEYNDRIKSEQDDLVDRHKEFEKLVTKLSPVFEQSKKGSNPLNYLEIIVSPIAIYKKYIDLISNSKKEILTFDKPPYSSITKYEIRESLKVLEDAIDRGVEAKSIWELPEEQDERTAKLQYFFNRFNPQKDKIKFIDELPAKVTVVDSKITLFSLAEPSVGVQSLITLAAESETLARGFKKLFELYWSNAEDPEKYKEIR